MGKRGRAKGGRGNNHGRAVFETAVARLAEKQEAAVQLHSFRALPVAKAAVSPSLPQLLIRFIEHPLFLAAFGVIGGIVGLISTPFLSIVGLCIVGAFHRAEVVSTRSWKVQVPAYILVFAGAFAIMYSVNKAIKQSFHIPTALEIATEIKKLNSSKQDGSKDGQNNGESKAVPFSVEDLAKIVVEKLKDQNWHPVDSLPQSAFDPAEGFVQYESRTFAVQDQNEMDIINSGDIHVGQTIKIKYDFANRGPRPVFDCQSWGMILPLDPTKNTVPKLRELVLSTAKTGYQKFKGSGSELGTGLTTHNFAVSYPLKQEEVDNLKSGKYRVYMLLFGAWTDDKNQPHYWTELEWTTWPQVPLAQSMWKII